jgi:hypothetical protein
VSVTIQKSTEVPHAAKCGRHFHLSFQYKLTRERRPHFAPRGTPDRAIIVIGQVISQNNGLLIGAQFRNRRHHKNTVRKLALDIKEVRRRAQIDVEDARKFGVAPLAKDILSAADDLERAVCFFYPAGTDLYLLWIFQTFNGCKKYCHCTVFGRLGNPMKI